MIDWQAVGQSLDADGFARLPGVLSEVDCRAIAALYGDDARFRSRIDMARFRFGVGEYKYFADPLPERIQALREELYAGLVPIANRWMARLKTDAAYPATLDGFLARCRAAGQSRPTPLLLKYMAGGYNCLHQDLYGALVFPLQLTVLLSEPGRGFTGGDFLLVEQRPRAQSRAEVVPLAQGEAVIFAVHHRPVRGTRGVYRVNLRHGVSRVRSGRRDTLGIIFHDAA